MAQYQPNAAKLLILCNIYHIAIERAALDGCHEVHNRHGPTFRMYTTCPPLESALCPPQPKPPNDEPDKHHARNIYPHHYLPPMALKKRILFALLTTVNEERAIAAPAIIGLSRTPIKG